MSNCKSCGAATMENESGVKVHTGGGRDVQVCRNGSCGFRGGQAGGFTACPQCGDSMSLNTDHSAN